MDHIHHLQSLLTSQMGLELNLIVVCSLGSERLCNNTFPITEIGSPPP